MVAVEYRVIWQRQGQAKKRRSYQTRSGVLACAEVQKSATDEMDWLSVPVSPLVFGPVIEQREVGDWAPSALTAEIRG